MFTLFKQISEKKLLYFLAFCIINITPSIILIDIACNDINIYNHKGLVDNFDFKHYLSKSNKCLIFLSLICIQLFYLTFFFNP